MPPRTRVKQRRRTTARKAAARGRQLGFERQTYEWCAGPCRARHNIATMISWNDQMMCVADATKAARDELTPGVKELRRELAKNKRHHA